MSGLDKMKNQILDEANHSAAVSYTHLLDRPAADELARWMAEHVTDK